MALLVIEGLHKKGEKGENWKIRQTEKRYNENQEYNEQLGQKTSPIDHEIKGRCAARLVQLRDCRARGPDLKTRDDLQKR